MKIENDKYYTKKTVAKECSSLIDLSPYDLVIEPSADFQTAEEYT